MNAKTFLAAGDVVINPAQITYAAIATDTDGLGLRLGFAGPSGTTGAELILQGIEARSILRWLRHNSEFLDAGSPPHTVGRARETIAVRA
jgi:hypothetical protein